MNKPFKCKVAEDCNGTLFIDFNPKDWKKGHVIMVYPVDRKTYDKLVERATNEIVKQIGPGPLFRGDRKRKTMLLAFAHKTAKNWVETTMKSIGLNLKTRDYENGHTDGVLSQGH